MSKASNKAVNAGVHTNIGMDFQKHSALYLLLENYDKIKGTRYFIILEHYDDIVFGYLDDDENVHKIETFQAKKSSKEWKLKQLFEILKKIVENGISLRADDIRKTDGYSQHQYFVSNQAMALQFKEKTTLHGKLVNETDCEIKFSTLEPKVQEYIKSVLRSELTCSSDKIIELENLSFKYIDLSKKSSSQREQLIGMFHTVFGDQVLDHAAAVDTLLHCFKKVESTFNQGNVARLSDQSKRVESTSIDLAINVITTKVKAYDLWRSKVEEICSTLQISVFDRDRFRLHFENSLDKFKDLKEMEHQKVYRFVSGMKYELSSYYKDEDCLGFLLSSFKSSNSTQLTDLQMKAAIFAAYIEIKELAS